MTLAGLCFSPTRCLSTFNQTQIGSCDLTIVQVTSFADAVVLNKVMLVNAQEHMHYKIVEGTVECKFISEPYVLKTALLISLLGIIGRTTFAREIHKTHIFCLKLYDCIFRFLSLFVSPKNS